MNFRDEYKKSAENASPDREAIDRMKSAVMAKLAEEQGSFPDIPQTPDRDDDTTSRTSGSKPLPLKRIAVIGGAVAACAVVTLSAVMLLPSLKNSGGMVNTATSSAAMDEAAAVDTAGGAGGADVASTANDYGDWDVETAADEPEYADAADCAEITEADEVAEVTEFVADDVPNEPNEPNVPNDLTDTTSTPSISDAGNTVIPSAPENAYTTNSEDSAGTSQTSLDKSSDIPEAAISGTYEENAEYDDNDILTDTGDEEPNTNSGEDNHNPGNGEILPYVTEEVENESVHYTAEAETTDAAELDGTFESGHNPSTGAPDNDAPEETLEMAECTDEVAIVTEEAEEEEQPKLILSDKGWLTYNGKRYDLDSSVTTAMFPLSPVTAANILDGKDYYLYINGYVLKVFDMQKNFLGLYRMRV